MKDKIKLIIDKYLIIFPEEKERLSRLIEYISKSSNDEITDKNNSNGYITAGACVYCKNEDKFLVVFHKDLKLYLYPGGHSDSKDISPLETAKRELREETGLCNLNLLSTKYDDVVPFDIDTHLIPYNKRINMPEHYHFDFRYLFSIKKTSDVIIDKSEVSGYKWISSEELSKDKNYGDIIKKISKIIETK